MDRKRGITALIGFILLAVVVTFVVDTEDTASQNSDVIKHDYTFTGESEHWSATFQVEGEEVSYEEEEVLKYDQEARSTFELTYKGTLDEFSSVKAFSYEYNTPTSGAEVNMNYEDGSPDEKVFTNSGNTLVRKDEKIEVTVQWDDNSETFILETSD